jgi:phosphoesterase RecJ-like protein
MYNYLGTKTMNTTQILQQIKNIIDLSTRILITGQGNPDGDSLGSQLALYGILMQQKRHSTLAQPPEIVISNDFPPPVQYDFFPNIDIIVPCEKIQDRQFEVGFVLDSGTDRVGKVLPVLEKCQHIINIDHHQSRKKGIEHIAWLEPEICSVAEMIYRFFEHPDWQVTLTADIAACLYGGIIYDTGAFRYPKTTPRTHQIAAKLLATGIDFARLTEQMFLERPLCAVRLLTAVLETLQRDAQGEIIWGYITQEMLRRVEAQLEQDEGIITQYAFTKGSKVAVLFKEISTNEVKISFRARGAIDVGRFARKLDPRGGGHHRAAGCTLSGTLESVQKSVIPELQKALHQTS